MIVEFHLFIWHKIPVLNRFPESGQFRLLLLMSSSVLLSGVLTEVFYSTMSFKK